MKEVKKQAENIFSKMDKSDWKLVSFGDVTREVRDVVNDPGAEGIDHVVGLEHLSSHDIHIRTWGNMENGAETFTRKFKKGQILFGKRRAYQRKAAIADFDGICSGDILVLEVNEDEMEPGLLPFLVHSDGFFNQAISTSAGSLSPRTKYKDLAQYKFRLPPRSLQKKLAQLLWANDNLEEEAMKTHLRFQSLFSSLLKDIFTDEKWKTHELDEILKIRRGASPRPIGDRSYFNVDGPGWVRIEDLQGVQKYLRNTKDHLSELGSSKSVKVASGDVIMSICATIGKPAILDMDACIHDGFVLFSEYEKILNNEFLFYFLKFKRKYFENQRQTGTQGNLNTTIVGKAKINLPPVNQQLLLLKKIHSAEDAMTDSEKYFRKTREMKSIITNMIFST